MAGAVLLNMRQRGVQIRHHFEGHLQRQKFFPKMVIGRWLQQVCWIMSVQGLLRGVICINHHVMRGQWRHQLGQGRHLGLVYQQAIQAVTHGRAAGFGIFNNGGTIQFIHRYLAISVFLMVVAMIIHLSVKYADRTQAIKKQNNSLLMMVMVQFLLGIFTLVMAVPVYMGVVHQLGALILLLLIVQNLFFGIGNEKSRAS